MSFSISHRTGHESDLLFLEAIGGPNSDSDFSQSSLKLRMTGWYLNNACMIRSLEKDIAPDGLAKDPWSLCTVRQVEELKALIRILPIWSSGIMIGVTIAQHAFPVLLANTMDRHFLGKIEIPGASFSLFGILTLTIWVAIYDWILVPLVSKYTKRPRGFSFKQRIGAGLVVSCLATAAAAEVERQSRKTTIQEGFLSNPKSVVSMSAN